jgi:hypothetical protein
MVRWCGVAHSYGPVAGDNEPWGPINVRNSSPMQILAAHVMPHITESLFHI